MRFLGLAPIPLDNLVHYCSEELHPTYWGWSVLYPTPLFLGLILDWT